MKLANFPRQIISSAILVYSVKSQTKTSLFQKEIAESLSTGKQGADSLECPVRLGTWRLHRNVSISAVTSGCAGSFVDDSMVEFS